MSKFFAKVVTLESGLGIVQIRRRLLTIRLWGSLFIVVFSLIVIVVFDVGGYGTADTDFGLLYIGKVASYDL